MGLPTDPYKWGDQKKTIQERMQGFDVKPSPAQPEDTTPPPGTPPNPEQIQTPEGAVDDAMAPTYGEPRQKTPEELEENPGVVRVHGINPDALDPSLAGGVPQQGDQPQPGAPQTLSAQEYPKQFEQAVSSQDPSGFQHGSGRSSATFKTEEDAAAAAVIMENERFFKNVKKNGLTVSAQWGDVDGHRLEEEEMSKDVNKAALAEFGASAETRLRFDTASQRAASKAVEELEEARDVIDNSFMVVMGPWNSYLKKASDNLADAIDLLQKEIDKF